jgi:hypothetical protein
MGRESFVAAMKRKDVKALGAIILRDIYGEEEKAKELADASRLTVPLIDRTCIGSEVEEAPEKEIEQEQDETTAEEVVEPELTDARKIQILIEKGKFKKAKKLLKELDEDHPNRKEFKKAIKAGLENE